MNGEPLKILLVEDNFDHAELIMRCFDDYHIANEIFHAADGEEALNYLFRKGKYEDLSSQQLPHLILLDLRLPKIDGLEVLKIIKSDEQLKKIPVVILTTSEEERDVASAYNYHVNSYLVKPMDFNNFVKLMNELGYYWLCWNVKPNLK